MNFNDLIHIYKKFKREPLKVFLRTDFTNYSPEYFRQAIRTLEIMGIVEIVPAIYTNGHNYRVRREVKGYRLKQR